jgi:hypothetical protein
VREIGSHIGGSTIAIASATRGCLLFVTIDEGGRTVPLRMIDADGRVGRTIEA